jgi:hypothetical protein
MRDFQALLKQRYSAARISPRSDVRKASMVPRGLERPSSQAFQTS